MVSLGPRRRHAPVDGDTAQSGRCAATPALARTWFDKRTGAGNQSVGALAQRFGDDEIQGTNLVAAECQREKIIALEPQLSVRRAQPKDAEAGVSGVGSVTSESRGRASSRAVQVVIGCARCCISRTRSTKLVTLPDLGVSAKQPVDFLLWSGEHGCLGSSAAMAWRRTCLRAAPRRPAVEPHDALSACRCGGQGRA